MRTNEELLAWLREAMKKAMATNTPIEVFIQAELTGDEPRRVQSIYAAETMKAIDARLAELRRRSQDLCARRELLSSSIDRAILLNNRRAAAKLIKDGKKLQSEFLRLSHDWEVYEAQLATFTDSCEDDDPLKGSHYDEGDDDSNPPSGGWGGRRRTPSPSSGAA